MKILLDTSVLYAAVLSHHPMHDRARPCLERVVRKRDKLFLSTHAMAELYATLSGSPPPYRVAPGALRLILRQNIEPYATFVPLDWNDYASVLDEIADRDFRGGIVYDALHLRAARKAKVQQVFTLNLRHFERLWPDHGGFIMMP